MRIGVDCRHITSKSLDDYRSFTREVFLLLAHLFPQHQFVFIIDKDEPVESLPTNVSITVIKPHCKNYFTYKWWYDVKLPLALNKQKIDVFVGTYGLCSLTSTRPQVLIVQDFFYRHKYSFHPKHSELFYKHNTASSIKKAKAIGVVSGTVQEELNSLLKYEKETTIISRASNNVYNALEWQERETVKDQYSDSCEYFILKTSGNFIAHFITALRAFSIFKKWQKSNMKLVVFDYEKKINNKNTKLDTYKHRNDVVILNGINKGEETKIVAASYAMLYLSPYEGFAVAVLEALQAEVPVIAPKGVAYEVAGEAALYAESNSPEEIADQLKRVYKDEKKRSEIIEEGKEKAKQFNWSTTANKVWQLIMRAASK